MRNYKNYPIYIKAMDLVLKIYTLTELINDNEKYGLISQMRRCAVSIPSNVAEGSARKGEKDFARFLGISLGSCFELNTQLLLTSRLSSVYQGSIDRVNILIQETEELSRMIFGLINNINKGDKP